MMHDAYLAGLLDGEGGVAIIYRSRRSDRRDEMQCYIHVAFTMTDRAPMDALSERFGGAVYHYKQPNPKWKDWYRWQRSGRNAEAVLRAAQPYALVKRKHIEIALKHQELLVQGGRATPERRAQIEESMRKRLALRDELRELNRRGVRDESSPTDLTGGAATGT